MKRIDIILFYKFSLRAKLFNLITQQISSFKTFYSQVLVSFNSNKLHFQQRKQKYRYIHTFSLQRKTELMK